MTDEDELLFGNGIRYQLENSLYVSLHAAVGLHFRYGGQAQFPDDTYTSSTATKSLAANSWHHLAATWNNGADEFTTITLYLDGVQVGTPAKTPLTISWGDELFLGAAQSKDPSIRSFGPGEMDEVRLWNVARTAEQINANKKQSLTGAEPGLVAYYRFDESSGTTAIDATNNGHDGLLVNSADPHVTSDLTLSAAAATLSQSIRISPETATTAKGLTQQFTAQGFYSDSSVLDLTSNVDWTSSDTSVATIDAGQALAREPGVSIIQASFAGVAGERVMLVTTPVLQSIALEAGRYEHREREKPTLHRHGNVFRWLDRGHHTPNPIDIHSGIRGDHRSFGISECPHRGNHIDHRIMGGSAGFVGRCRNRADSAISRCNPRSTEGCERIDAAIKGFRTLFRRLHQGPQQRGRLDRRR